MTTQERINVLESEILANKAYLDNTDYKVIKAQETGEDILDEILLSRSSAREKINENEGLLLTLRAQLMTEIDEVHTLLTNQ